MFLNIPTVTYFWIVKLRQACLFIVYVVLNKSFLGTLLSYMLASYALQQTWRIFLVLHCQFNYYIIQNFSLTHDLSSSWNGSCGGLSWT